jgi:hypothetical protein
METTKNYRIILSTAYLPNVQYFTKLLHGTVALEQHENYLKQTYRNRCEILTANGVMSLSIPVKHCAPKIKIRDVRIDYTDDWQKIHRRTIISAYGSSPFFEYYADDLLPFYEKKEEFLFDFNRNLLNTLLELTSIRADICLSGSYTHDYDRDYRTSINPKTKLNDPCFTVVPYYQVFGSKFAFQPNLSILDLLCSEGNNTYSILKQSTVNGER